MADRSVLQRFEQAGPLTWLLAAAAAWAVLLWLAGLLGLGSAVAPSPTIAAATPLPQARAPTPDRIGPLARYADAASRPLFTEDRRPRSFIATASDGAIETQAQSLDFILTGVLISPQVRLAILQPTNGGESQRVREGNSPEGVTGWRLIAVQPRRVVFQGNGGESTLDLRTFGDDATGEKGALTGTNNPSDGTAVAIGAAVAAAQAASDAADAAPVASTDAARIDAIRKRIEARRAQMRNADPNSPAPPPPMSAPATQ